MLKPDQLRAVIVSANPHFIDHPEQLAIFLDSGHIVSYGASSLSFEYRYTLNIIVQDYPHHANLIILPLLIFLRTQQPELFENPERAKDLIRFEAEILNQTSIDLSLQVDLTERVIVQQKENQMLITHAPEPMHPDFPSQEKTFELIDRKSQQILSTFTVPAWRPPLSIFNEN